MAKFRITTKDATGRSTSKIDAPNERIAAAEAQRALADMAKDELPNCKRRLRCRRVQRPLARHRLCSDQH